MKFNKFERTIVNIQKSGLYMNKELLDDDNKYIPQEIRDHIFEKALYTIKYELIIFNIDNIERKVNLNFIVFSKSDINDKSLQNYDMYARNVFLILDLLFSYTNKDCSKTQDIYIYMTNFKRELPNTKDVILGPININGGASYTCPINGNIIIYRKEEWFKILIHESFHNLGLDFSNMHLSHFNKKIRSIFPIISEFNIFESYCEFWAVILNSVIISFLNTYHLNDFDKFTNKFKKYMQIETIFTYIQVVKILNYMGLKYQDLYDENIKIREKFKENTNIFAYYICKMILLNNYNKYILWCIEHNNNYFDFNKTQYALNALLKYIEDNYKDTNLLENINNINILFNYKSNDQYKRSINRRDKVYTKRCKEKSKGSCKLHRRYLYYDKIKIFRSKSLCLSSIEME